MKTWHKSRSFFEACRFAFAGISAVFSQEPNVRRQMLLFVSGIVIAAILRVSTVELAILAIAIAFVLSMEFFNTALEKIEDLVWPEYREAVRFSKDAAAGGVLIASIGAAIAAGLIFVPAIVRLLVY